jgi:hypothetical protein
MKNIGRLTKLVIVLLFTALMGCVSVPPYESRIQTVDSLLLQYDWQKLKITTSEGDLAVFKPRLLDCSGEDLLSVYIEGDGFAWRTSSQPSSNPTPINPIGLKLALQHPNQCVVYMARPCQYVDLASSHCQTADWTRARFSRKAVQMTDEGLQQLKDQSGRDKLQLIGYSGGAAISLLVAAQRDDVQKIVTVAGNVMPHVWAKNLRLSPLRASLSPLRYKEKLARIPQIHYVGGLDKVISYDFLKDYQQRMGLNAPITIQLYPEYGHHKGWLENWSKISPFL